MPQDVDLVTTLAASFALATVLGLLATRLKMPPMVGYLLAGILLGPGTPGFVADIALAKQLAELGVMLLMFGVGLHFSLDDLAAVRRIAVPGAIVQMTAVTALGFGAAYAWGWTPGAALVFGLALSVASTVVVLRALEARLTLNSIDAKIAVGWLIVEDLLVILVLLLLPPLATTLGSSTAVEGDTGTPLWLSVLATIGKALAFVTFMVVAGRRLLPRLLWVVARSGSRELFTLCVIAAAVGVAYAASAIFDVSFALGAFFAGMMMRESELSHRAAEQSLPLRDAFAVLFFVSVGMLFDPLILIEEPVKLLVALVIVMIGSPIVAMILVVGFRYPLNTALILGASLSQIGEFSFILGALGVSLGLMSAQGQSLIVAVAILSIAANPFVFSLMRPAYAWMRAHPRLALRVGRGPDPLAALPDSTARTKLTGQVVLVGYGRVGRRIAQTLTEHEIPFIVAEQNRERVEQLRSQALAAVFGDASQPSVLIQAHIATAGMLVIATPDTVSVRKMAELARALNPTIEIVVRTHSEHEARLLAEERIGTIFFGEQELALAMTRHVLSRRGLEPAPLEGTIAS